MFRFIAKKFITKTFTFIQRTGFTTQPTDTIYAVCSGYGKSGVAVIRVSGPRASEALFKLTDFRKFPTARVTNLKYIRHIGTHKILDKGLVVWFPAPHSFTGEDTCEFHVHGGLAIIKGLMSSLSKIQRYRLAGNGEFSKRAVLNNKMDVSRAEGYADLINAETEFQREQAYNLSSGSASNCINKWKDAIYEQLSLLEALFNFEIIPVNSINPLSEIQKKIIDINREIYMKVMDADRGQRLRDGVKGIIIGEPNVGKSTLYNLICAANAAIVSEYPGTTRDVLVMNLDYRGYPLTLYDSCGIHYGKMHPVEAIAINLTKESIHKSDLIILVIDAKKYVAWKKDNKHRSVLQFIIEHCIGLKLEYEIHGYPLTVNNIFKKDCIIIFNKCDELTEIIDQQEISEVFCVSAKTKFGLEALHNHLYARLKFMCANPETESTVITNVRHRLLLNACHADLDSFNKTLSVNITKGITHDYAILANHLRQVLKKFTVYLNGTDTNMPDVLDQIFQSFCVGK